MSEKSIRKFISNYVAGCYENPSRETMIEAGWYDWFCDDTELKPRLDAMFPKVEQIAHSAKVDMDTMYVFFKNNCPGVGDIYDDFRICDMRTGDVIFTVCPASGHERTMGRADLWGRENNFKGALAEGTWEDITNYFGIVVLKRQVMEYTVNGTKKVIGKFGKSTQQEFDEALASLPGLIKSAREGNSEAGQTANNLLWQLANESFGTRHFDENRFVEVFPFGKLEGVQA